MSVPQSSASVVQSRVARSARTRPTGSPAASIYGGSLLESVAAAFLRQHRAGDETRATCQADEVPCK